MMTDTKDIEVTNIGKADRVFFDADNRPVRVKPGETMRATVSKQIADRFGAASEQGDTLKMGGSPKE
jgi:hypothetical protein